MYRRLGPAPASSTGERRWLLGIVLGGAAFGLSTRVTLVEWEIHGP